MELWTIQSGATCEKPFCALTKVEIPNAANRWLPFRDGHPAAPEAAVAVLPELGEILAKLDDSSAPTAADTSWAIAPSASIRPSGLCGIYGQKTFEPALEDQGPWILVSGTTRGCNPLRVGLRAAATLAPRALVDAVGLGPIVAQYVAPVEATAVDTPEQQRARRLAEIRYRTARILSTSSDVDVRDLQKARALLECAAEFAAIVNAPS